MDLVKKKFENEPSFQLKKQKDNKYPSKSRNIDMIN